MPQRSFHCIVCRRNSFDVRETPQTFLRFEQLEACCGRFRAQALRPFLKGLLDLAPQAAHPLLKPIPGQSPITHLVPAAEQSLRQGKQPSSDFLTVAASADHRLKAAGTGQAMEPIFVDNRLDPGQFSDLKDQRFGVFAGETMAASAASGWLTMDRLMNLLGRD
jgi:hypothetical protein